MTATQNEYEQKQNIVGHGACWSNTNRSAVPPEVEWSQRQSTFFKAQGTSSEFQNLHGECCEGFAGKHETFL